MARACPFSVGKLRLDGVRRRLELLNRRHVAFGRIEAGRKKRLLAFGAGRRRLDLTERACKIARHKPAQLVQFDMIVVAGVHQVGGKRLPSPALIALDNHGSRPGWCRGAGRRRHAKGKHEGVAYPPDISAGVIDGAAVGPASGVGDAGKLVNVRADMPHRRHEPGKLLLVDGRAA